MKRNTILISIAMIVFSAISVNAQLGSVKKAIKGKNKSKTAENKGNESISDSLNKNYLFVGKDGLDGEKTSELKVCATDDGTYMNEYRSLFKKWYQDISLTSQEKMYGKGTCQLMGFQIIDNKSYRYRNVDSLETLAQGASAYKFDGEKLVLVKDFTTSSLYVVVVPQVAKSGLKLANLRLGVTPDLKNTYRKKTESVFNYHNLKQALYIFKKYEANPSQYETNAVLFSEEDYQKLNKQGKFKGLVIYKLVGDRLEPMK